MTRSQSEDRPVPQWRATRWLVEPASDVPGHIRAGLLASFIGSVPSFVAGAATTTLLYVAAAIRHPEAAFVGLVVVDVLLVALRFTLLFVLSRGRPAGRVPVLDVFLLTSVAWTAVIGFGAALCFLSGDHVLQLLASVAMVAMVGGIATRNYCVPRLALCQILLCDLPFTFAILTLSEPWLLIFVAQCPFYLLSMISTIYRLHRGYLTIALGEWENERRATHDALTGLLNRPGLMAALADKLGVSTSGSERFALLYLDLDGFKQVNDEFGHAGGDALLRQVAQRFGAAAPGTAVSARLGGDEFVMLIPDHGSDDAFALGLELIDASRPPYELGSGISARVGVSIGVACAAPGMTPDQLLAEADAALYRAKAGGKNRVVLATPADERPPAAPDAPARRAA